MSPTAGFPTREARAPSAADRRRGGVAMITVLVALVALIGASALTIDGGMLWAARTQVQNAADASALAAGRSLIDASIPAVTLSASEAAAVAQASQNSAVSTPSVNVLSADITFGNWDLDTGSFDSGVDLSDPGQVTAVDVVARLDATTTGRVPAFMARVLGRDDFAVSARATAYLGFAGSMGPGEVELPIAIDCCKLSGSDCRQDYCSTIQSSPPNPCSLVNPQGEGATTVSCLEFNSTPEQNACWTVFDGQSPSVNAPSLIDIVQDGNPVEVSTAMPVFLDNGDKTPVISEINDRFRGDGAFVGDAAGVDRYAPVHSPPEPDSWVVGLPVVECQSETHCAGGDPGTIVGVVCFEIREITVTPDKILRGRFICRSDPLWDECGVGTTGSGGLDFGMRADLPVLVR
jgi:Flp pilus assembly protein TadG